GWVEVPTIFGVYLGVDLLMYNFAEPVLYGSSTGLSALAVLVAAVFWTWLWGPAGLLLATPLTVCVVVIGRHVPRLAFLEVLLSDEPVLPPQSRFYQRMLAMDAEEASLLCEEFLKGRSLVELYDEVIVRALNLAEEDRHRGKLDEVKQQFIFQNTRILIEDMAERATELIAGNSPAKLSLFSKADPEDRIALETTGPVDVVCIPARDEADELAALMMKLLLQKRGVGARVVASGVSPAKVIDEVKRSNPKAVCVVAVPPFAYMHTRYLCRRLRSRFSELKLAIALLTESQDDQPRPGSNLPPVDETAATLREAENSIVSLSRAQTDKLAPAPAVH
ncbi:MAG TPA: AI-2E family transporter, partial [Patescibacteria group bacterium]|nr:AI-2E family transporter [Patescibacteria group bacterium]